MEKLRRNKGITLVALVITIIILLILAGISILTINQTILFKNAKQAKESMINAQNLENRTLSSYENKINTVITGNREQITIDKAEYDLLKNNINYSEEEKKIGNWIDGKEIYAKTILINTLNAGAWNDINHNIDNIDKCIDYTGKIYLKRKGEYSLFNLDGGCGIESENKIYTLFTTKNYSIYIGGTYSFDNNSYGYITLKYTKITK